MSHTKCEKCGAYTHEWNEEESHGFIGLEPCPNMTPEQIKKNLIQYFKVFQEHSKRDSNTHSHAQQRVNKAIKEKEFWKGEYFIIKAENNALRKKIN